MLSVGSVSGARSTVVNASPQRSHALQQDRSQIPQRRRTAGHRARLPVGADDSASRPAGPARCRPTSDLQLTRRSGYHPGRNTENRREADLAANSHCPNNRAAMPCSRRRGPASEPGRLRRVSCAASVQRRTRAPADDPAPGAAARVPSTRSTAPRIVSEGWTLSTNVRPADAKSVVPFRGAGRSRARRPRHASPLRTHSHSAGQPRPETAVLRVPIPVERRPLPDYWSLRKPGDRRFDLTTVCRCNGPATDFGKPVAWLPVVELLRDNNRYVRRRIWDSGTDVISPYFGSAAG